MRLSYSNFLLAFLLSALCVSTASAKSAYDTAIVDYKAGRFKQAVSGFSLAITQEPSKQLYHYLLANSLVHVDQHVRAAGEYKVAYSLDPSSTIGEFSRQALLAYHKPAAASAPSSAQAYVPDQNEIAKVKKIIQRQLDSEKNKHDSLATRNAQNMRSQLDDDLRLVDERMQRDIQRLSDPLIFDPGPRVNTLPNHPELLKEREDQIRAAAAAEKERLRRAASERSGTVESWRKDKDALLDEAAGNLQTQLEQPVGRSGVKLQAHGTGLYVRNYAKGGPNYLPDPHAATARISDVRDSAGSGATTAETSVDRHKEDGKEVKGSVLRQ